MCKYLAYAVRTRFPRRVYIVGAVRYRYCGKSDITNNPSKPECGSCSALGCQLIRHFPAEAEAEAKRMEIAIISTSITLAVEYERNPADYSEMMCVAF